MRLVAPAPDEAPQRPAVLTDLVRAVILSAAEAHGMVNVRVFGSSARGQYGSAGDLDLIVGLQSQRGYSDLLAFCDQLEAKLGRRVDVIVEDALDPRLHREILAGSRPV